MDNYAEKLRTARESHTVPLEAFKRMCIPGDKTRLFCFVEAAFDKRFYTMRVRTLLNEQPTTIPCSKKNNVVRIYDVLQEDIVYEKNRIAYFVDNDFDPPLKNSGIYETPCYSLENLYIIAETVQVVVEELCKISVTDKDFLTIMKLYTDLLENFVDQILLLNAWLACQRELYTVGSSPLHIDTTLRKYFMDLVTPDFNLSASLDSLNSKERVESIFSTAVSVDEKILSEKIDEFKSMNIPQIIRGRFLTKFMFNFFQRVPDWIKDPQSESLDKTISVKIAGDYDQFLSDITDKVLLPSCMIRYIQSFKN